MSEKRNKRERGAVELVADEEGMARDGAVTFSALKLYGIYGPGRSKTRLIALVPCTISKRVNKLPAAALFSTDVFCCHLSPPLGFK